MLFRHWLPVLSLSAIASASLMQPRGGSGDTCAKLDCDLNIGYQNFGKLNVCLCESGIDDFIATNPVAKKAAAAVGKQRVEQALTQQIKSGMHVSSCTQHSYRKRSPAELARLEHKCEFGLTKCGIYTGSTPSSHTSPPTKTTPDYAMLEAYECLDTMTNLESCGGCTEPYTLGLTPNEIAELKPGVDCTAATGVSDVQCRRGYCVVNKCKRGYELVPIIGGIDGLFECVEKGSGGGGAEMHMHKQVGGTLQWKN